MSRVNDYPLKQILLIVPTSLLVLLLTGCGAGADDSTQENPAEDIPIAIPVETSEVLLGSVSAAYQGTATLEAEQTTMVVSKNTGVIVEVLVEEGDTVEQGQVVARLESNRFELEAQRTKATLEQMDNALVRAEELYSRKLMSSDEYDPSKFDAASQEAIHKLAALDLYNTEIRAPIGGVISERMIKVGNLVTQHQEVYRIDDFDPLLAVLHVPERELNTLRQNHRVSISVDAFPNEVFEGFVLRVSPVVDPTTGTFKVTAQINDDSTRLKPGLFGRVRVIYDTRDNVTLVSKDAIVSEDGVYSTYLVAADLSVTQQVIQVGYEENGMLEVLSGLDYGDTVVTAGKGSLRDGAIIEVVES